MILSSSCPFEVGALVYAYLRHSPGDNQSIDSQDAAVREWYDKHSLILLRVFKDESRTGSTTAGRDDFLLMIDTLRQASGNAKPAGVVLWSFSRFARDYDAAEFYKADLRRRGYLIHSLTDQIPEGPTGRIVEAITHWKDEERLREISKDSQRGLQWLAEQGYSIGGYPPKGYKKSAPIQIGKKKNGEPRLARKWEIDPEFETLVRKAWEMKLAGRSHLAIHRATRLFKGVTGYTAFFSNISYAGYRRCAKLIVPEAQPAYISKVDFDRIQAARLPARYTAGSLIEHPRRRQEENPFILSGLLYCGYCGGAMVANTNGQARNYRCLRRTRNGLEACTQHGIVAYWLHRAVCNWVAENVISLDHFLAAREEVNRRLSATTQELKQRRTSLNKNLSQVNRSIKNLLDAIEASGFSQEIGARLAERKVERAKLEAEVHQITELQKVQAIDVSDEVLAHLVTHLSEELASGSPNEVRGVLRQVLRRVELYEDKLVIQHVAPIVPQASGEKVGYGLDSDGCLGRTTSARGNPIWTSTTLSNSGSR